MLRAGLSASAELLERHPARKRSRSILSSRQSAQGTDYSAVGWCCVASAGNTVDYDQSYFHN